MAASFLSAVSKAGYDSIKLDASPKVRPFRRRIGKASNSFALHHEHASNSFAANRHQLAAGLCVAVRPVSVDSFGNERLRRFPAFVYGGIHGADRAGSFAL